MIPLSKPRELWWLSFYKQQQFLGGCIVEASGFLEACLEAHLLEINPGGKVHGVCVKDIPSEYHDQLLSEAELKAAGLI